MVSFLSRYHNTLAPDWVVHPVLAKCSILEKYNDIVTHLVAVISVAMHDCQAVVQPSPAQHEVLAAQLFDFKVLHRWVPPAEAAGLASACRAGLASAAAKIQAAAVKILAEVVRGIRRISAADGRSLQRTLGSASMSRSRGATQRHLIEALCAPEATMTDLSDEKLTELHGKFAKVVEELQKPEEGVQEPLPWWRCATMADAGLEQYLVSRLTEVSDAVLLRVSEVREKLVQAFILASEFVRGLPDMDQEVDAYLSRLRPCKNTLSEWIGILRNLILRLDHLKVAVAKCVPKLDAVSSEALLSACKEACAEAAGCLRRGTESAAPLDITDGMAAFSELHRSAQLCQLVLEGHLCMAAAITFHSALGPGCEHDKRKKCQFTGCITRARATRKLLAEAGNVVLHPGFEQKLKEITKSAEAPLARAPALSLSLSEADEPMLLPIVAAPAKSKDKAKATAAKSKARR